MKIKYLIISILLSTAAFAEQSSWNINTGCSQISNETDQNTEITPGSRVKASYEYTSQNNNLFGASFSILDVNNEQDYEFSLFLKTNLYIGHTFHPCENTQITPIISINNEHMGSLLTLLFPVYESINIDSIGTGTRLSHQLNERMEVAINTEIKFPFRSEFTNWFGDTKLKNNPSYHIDIPISYKLTEKLITSLTGEYEFHNLESKETFDIKSTLNFFTAYLGLEYHY
jgi:hypothetical protein